MDIDTRVRPGEGKQQYRDRMIKAMGRFVEHQRRGIAAGAIPVVMDVDDFGFLMPGFDDLLALKKSLPGLRITCFTIPLPKEFNEVENAKQFSFEKYGKWAELVNAHEWIEVALHGFSHTHHEMEGTYEKTMTILQATENLFERVGLKYVKIFKAPYWQYSWDALTALRDRGYTIAIDRNHPRPVPDGSKTYLYNWSFEEPLATTPIIKGHGHFTGNNQNNIGDTLGNILHHLPSTTRFLTISEYLKLHEK